MLASGAMMLYGLTIGLVGPESSFFPAALVNQETFHSVLKVQIELIRGILGICVVAAIWSFTSVARHPEARITSKASTFAAITISVMLFGGWLMTEHIGRRADTQARANMLRRGYSTASAINPEHVAKLSASPSDVKTANYQYLKQQLQSIHRANRDCRFVYLMAKRHGQIVFLIDAEPDGSPDCSAPGDVYIDASDELKVRFAAEQDYVGGPGVDRWGSWVTIFSTIRDPGSHRVIAMLGMDVSAAQFSRGIALSRLAAMILSLLLCTLVVTFFLVYQNTREAGALIEASEHRYRGLVEGSPNWISLFDQDLRILTINQSALSNTGWKESEIIGRSYIDVWPEESRRTVEQAVRKVLSRKQASFESITQHADGSSIDWYVVLNPMSDERESNNRFVGIAVDITKLRQAGTALEESEEKYRTLFDSSADGLFLMTDVFLDCNEQACRMWECDRSEIIGVSPEVFSPKFQPDGRSSSEASREYMQAAFDGIPQRSPARFWNARYRCA
jgi:PAS domain S-box-containing protein